MDYFSLIYPLLVDLQLVVKCFLFLPKYRRNAQHGTTSTPFTQPLEPAASAARTHVKPPRPTRAPTAPMRGAGKPSGEEKANSLFAGKVLRLMESDEHLWPGCCLPPAHFSAGCPRRLPRRYPAHPQPCTLGMGNEIFTGTFLKAPASGHFVDARLTLLCWRTQGKPRPHPWGKSSSRWDERAPGHRTASAPRGNVRIRGTDGDLLVEVRRTHLLMRKRMMAATLPSPPAIHFTLFSETSTESKKGRGVRTPPCAPCGWLTRKSIPHHREEAGMRRAPADQLRTRPSSSTPHRLH